MFCGWDKDGEPLAKRRRNARVQLAAVEYSQTDNTFEMIRVLVSDELSRDCGLEVMMNDVWGFFGRVVFSVFLVLRVARKVIVLRSCCIMRLSTGFRLMAVSG